jgi:hypothetical protein
MDATLLEELKAVRGLVQGATLDEQSRSTALWCLGRLPAVYRRFRETSDVRDGEEIRRLIEGLRAALADAPRESEAATDRLLAMHARLGIPAPRLAPVKQPRKRKAG